MRIVMNTGEEPLPVHLEPETVNVYGNEFSRRIQHYRNRFLPPLAEFFLAHMPRERAEKVVYPFGGGDLISALIPFAGVPEITTISLEQVGDPARIHIISRAELLRSLRSLNTQTGGMLSVGSNTSENLSNSQLNYLPVQLISFLLALVVHGYEPVAVYYFTLNGDGDIHYLDENDIIELNKQRPDRLRLSWCRPNFSPAFANVEIQYKSNNTGDKHGTEGQGPNPVFRHIAASLSNGRLINNNPLRKHLEGKGQVNGLVKGASYLLWQDEYAVFRDYMLAHMPFIVSDSTGIPPGYAVAAGFRIKTFGRFNGSFLRANRTHNQAFCELWGKNPYIGMPSRFGYVDSHGQPHMMFSIKA